MDEKIVFRVFTKHSFKAITTSKIAAKIIRWTIVKVKHIFKKKHNLLCHKMRKQSIYFHKRIVLQQRYEKSYWTIRRCRSFSSCWDICQWQSFVNFINL